jgi:MraZ protein
MTGFLGEYDCKLDPKGRIILPAGLKRQVPAEAEDTFVVNRGFEKCLVLYPKNEWEKISLEINN